jgi:hypothetical protein
MKSDQYATPDSEPVMQHTGKDPACRHEAETRSPVPPSPKKPLATLPHL